jgi:hypothetical protein
MGTVSNSSAYPKFSWIDVTIKPPGAAGTYKHWGEAAAATLCVLKFVGHASAALNQCGGSWGPLCLQHD